MSFVIKRFHPLQLWTFPAEKLIPAPWSAPSIEQKTVCWPVTRFQRLGRRSSLYPLLSPETSTVLNSLDKKSISSNCQRFSGMVEALLPSTVPPWNFKTSHLKPMRSFQQECRGMSTSSRASWLTESTWSGYCPLQLGGPTTCFSPLSLLNEKRRHLTTVTASPASKTSAALSARSSMNQQTATSLRAVGVPLHPKPSQITPMQQQQQSHTKTSGGTHAAGPRYTSSTAPSHGNFSSVPLKPEPALVGPTGTPIHKTPESSGAERPWRELSWKHREVDHARNQVWRRGETCRPLPAGDAASAVMDSTEAPPTEGEGSAGKMMIIDSTALLYRAYFKVESRLRNNTGWATEEALHEGDVIGTVFAFLDIVFTLLEQWRPSHVALVFDSPGPTFRKEMYKDYKKNRSPMPDALRAAVPYVLGAVRASNLRQLQEPGVEADDVIATLAEEALQANMLVKVASPDKDFFQLLCPRLKLLRPDTRGSRFTTAASRNTAASSSSSVSTSPDFWTSMVSGHLLSFKIFGVEEFRVKFGLEPEQFVDLLALMGDKCDDVPGARGIGEKTAPLLMKEFGTLDNLLERIDQIKELKYRRAVMGSQEDILLSRELVVLKRDVKHGVTVDELKLEKPSDENYFWNLVDSLELDSVQMGSLKKRIKVFWSSLDVRQSN